MWGPNKLHARASCSDLNGDYKARAKLVRDGAVDKYSVWFTKLNTTYSTDWHYCVSGCHDAFEVSHVWSSPLC